MKSIFLKYKNSGTITTLEEVLDANLRPDLILNLLEVAGEADSKLDLENFMAKNRDIKQYLLFKRNTDSAVISFEQLLEDNVTCTEIKANYTVLGVSELKNELVVKNEGAKDLTSEEIKRADFQVAKDRIKEFSRNTKDDISLPRADESKGAREFLGDFIFGRGLGLDHKITGKEFNVLTQQIQDHLIDINNTHNSLIKEFGQVYTALDGLDEGYIQGILKAINEVKLTSNSLKKTHNSLDETVTFLSEKLPDMDNDISTLKIQLEDCVNIEHISEVWQVLEEQKSRLDSLADSDVIDAIEVQVKEHNKKLEQVAYDSELKELKLLVNELNTKLDTKEDANEKLEKIIAQISRRVNIACYYTTAVVIIVVLSFMFK